MSGGISKIYALVHPISGLIVYIGKCVTQLNRRLSNHEYKARSRRDSSPKGKWIRDLQGQGLRPAIKLLEETEEKWQDAERRWISKLRSEGLSLFNLHPGGNGAHTRASLRSDLVPLLGKISDGRIAEKAGLCRETITYHRKRAGIDASKDRSRIKNTFKKGRPAHNKIEFPDALTSRLGQESDRKLAATFDVSRAVIRNRRKTSGISPVPTPPPRKGAQHHNSQLTEEIVRQIRIRHKVGSRTDGCSAIARELGLHITTVYAAIHRKTWRHVI